MKKYVALISSLLLVACANCHKQKAEQPAVAPAAAVVAPLPCMQPQPKPCPCAQAKPVQEPVQVNPCKCAYRPDPCRQVQRPRIVEQVKEEPCPKCAEYKQILNCGCGQCNTFEQKPVMHQTVTTTTVIPADEYYAQSTQPKTYVPFLPESYILASNRAFSRFVKDTYNIYGAKPEIKVYIKEGQLKASDLPGGIEKGVQNFANRLQGSRTFAVTNNPAEADYIVATTAEWFDTPSKDVPAIKYTTTLTDSKNNTVKEWVEIVKKADRSWL